MNRIPLSLDPFLPRALDQEWADAYTGRELPRVRALALEELPLSVHAELSIVRGVVGETRLQGTIAGEMGLRCERCLQPMAWPIHLEADVVLVRPGEVPEGLGEGQEVVEVDPDGLFRPAAWVEEEILLALPLVPRHPDCGAEHEREFEPGEGDRQVENPFAVLEQLKKKP